MAVKDNRMFDEVYSKLVIKAESFIRNLYNLRTAGYRTDETKLVELSIYINYLEGIKNSRYTYYYVDKLTNISNFLNTL